jgi:hypothetical protein
MISLRRIPVYKASLTIHRKNGVGCALQTAINRSSSAPSKRLFRPSPALDFCTLHTGFTASLTPHSRMAALCRLLCRSKVKWVKGFIV